MPKQILKSVGRSAANATLADVMTVQYLLNCVPVQHGGPPIELEIDGLIGPKTMKAIDAFQARWFSWVDGRVDPNGQTLGALLTYDPAPHQPLPPPGGSDIKNAGHAPAGSKHGGPGDNFGGAGYKIGSPGTGYKTGAPGAGHKTGAPGAGHKTGAPGAGHKTGGPGAGYKTGGPGAGHKTGGPGAGYKTGAPGAGYKTGAPGAGHKSGGFGTKGF